MSLKRHITVRLWCPEPARDPKDPARSLGMMMGIMAATSRARALHLWLSGSGSAAPMRVYAVLYYTLFGLLRRCRRRTPPTNTNYFHDYFCDRYECEKDDKYSLQSCARGPRSLHPKGWAVLTCQSGILMIGFRLCDCHF